MSRWLYRFPINLTLPLLLLLAGLGLVSLYTVNLVQEQQRSILENSERELTNEVSRMQRLVQHLIGRQEHARIQEEMVALNPDIRVRQARVVDDQNRIMAALQRSERGRSLGDSASSSEAVALEEAVVELLAVARDRRAAQVRYLEADNVLVASAPLEIMGPSIQLGPSPAGGVILAWDLSYPFQQAREAALGSAAVMSPVLVAAFVGLWWLLYLVLGRRLGRLTRTAELIAAGDTRERARVGGEDEIGRLGGAFNTMADSLVREQEQLRASEQRLYLAQAFAGVGSWEWDIASGRVTWTRATARLMDLAEDDTEVTFDRYLEGIHPDDRQRVRDAVNATLESGEPYGIEHRVATRDDGERWLLASGDVARNEQRQPLRMYGIVHDITAIKQAESALFRQKEYAQVTLASIGDGVVTTDTAGRVAFLNPVAEYLTGWNSNRARGRPVTEVFNIINEVTGKPATNPVERCLREGRIVGLANHTLLLRDDGEQFAIEDSAAPIRDRDGAVMGVVLVFHDVTHARELANQLSWQATHDALTGLHNRYAFEQRLEHLAHYPESTRGRERHTLLYVDLDQFKVINDVAGHVAGDQMLRQVAGLMLEQVRDTDLLARLGGDEFGVILTHCDIEHAERVAGALHRVLDDYRFAWESRTFRVSASIGILEFHPGKQTMTELLSDADIAVYAAKNAGRRRSHVFRADDQALMRERREMDWATQISDAVDDERLELFAQAIVPLARQSAAGDALSFEVLVRMRGPEGALIPPGAFLPAAERFDLISMVDRWIITRTFSLLADHLRSRGEQSIAHCAVNLSGSTLSDESLLPFIKNQLSLHHLPAEIVCFEVTETAAISNFQSAIRFIRDLRAMGCRFALDDFGSGLSSFAYLRTLPVDYLKIDGSFVRDIAHDEVNQALVSNINAVGHLLGKRTIAEFAEDDHTIARLRELGVDYAQGYGLHRPEPLKDLLAAGGRPGGHKQ